MAKSEEREREREGKGGDDKERKMKMKMKMKNKDANPHDLPGRGARSDGTLFFFHPSQDENKQTNWLHTLGE